MSTRSSLRLKTVEGTLANIEDLGDQSGIVGVCRDTEEGAEIMFQVGLG